MRNWWLSHEYWLLSKMGILCWSINLHQDFSWPLWQVVCLRNKGSATWGIMTAFRWAFLILVSTDFYINIKFVQFQIFNILCRSVLPWGCPSLMSGLAGWDFVWFNRWIMISQFLNWGMFEFDRSQIQKRARLWMTKIQRSSVVSMEEQDTTANTGSRFFAVIFIAINMMMIIIKIHLSLPTGSSHLLVLRQESWWLMLRSFLAVTFEMFCCNRYKY